MYSISSKIGIANYEKNNYSISRKMGRPQNLRENNARINDFISGAP